jgi:TgpA N-terminal domain/Transglutaminase-like superfamily/Domain of unknown function (DUF4129)
MERQELPVVVALCALSASVALAFGRVFDSTAYVVPLLVAAVLPHVVAAIVRWRGGNGTVTWLASAVTLVLYVFVALPGSGSPGAIVDRVQGGWNVARNHDLPLPATHGAVLLAVLVVWLTAALSDDLAFRWHAALGAIAPGVMVLVWIAALGDHDGLGGTVAWFGAAAAVFLATQHQVLLRHHRTRLGTPRVVDSPRFLMSGVLLGVVAVVIGVVVAPAIPGSEDRLFDLGGIGSGGSDKYVSPPPLLNVGDELRRGAEQTLFTVQASSADYWRITALDQYDSALGGQWTLAAEGDGAVSQGLDGEVPADALTQRYRIGPLGERWMPAAYRPARVNRDDLLVIRSSSTLVTKNDSVKGLRYTVESAPPTLVLSPAQRERAAGAVPAALRQYTDLPTDFPTSVIAQAQQVAAGLTNAYDKALALRDFFRDGSFVYDVNVDARDDQSAIAEFLSSRRGFCVQFASAYATMARAVGIPARVAVGFTPGTPKNGVYEVTNFDAHAWPEVWLAGVGWTHAFDPTPPSDAAGGSALPKEAPVSSTAARQPQQQSTPVTTPVTTPQPSTDAPTPPASSPTAPAPNSITVNPDAGDSGSGSDSGWIIAGIVAITLLVVGPALAIVVVKSRRRRQRRTHTDPAVAVTAAWVEAMDDLADHRLRWPPSDTPRELARRVPGLAGDDTAAPLRALADSYSGVRYGGVTPDAEAAANAWREADALRDALDESSGFFGRLRARLDPTTLRRTREPV